MNFQYNSKRIKKIHLLYKGDINKLEELCKNI